MSLERELTGPLTIDLSSPLVFEDVEGGELVDARVTTTGAVRVTAAGATRVFTAPSS